MEYHYINSLRDVPKFENIIIKFTTTMIDLCLNVKNPIVE